MANAVAAEECSEVSASPATTLTVTTRAADLKSRSALPIAETNFSLSRPLARLLFLTVQGGYLAMYCAALYKADATREVVARARGGSAVIVAPLVLVVAMCGIAVRLYLLASVGLNHPAAGANFQRLFPALFILDTLWAVSPLLLLSKIGYGLALASIAPLVYLPFSQRTLVQSIYPRQG